MTAKLRIQAAKYPDEQIWQYLLGFLYEQKKQYDKAVIAYNYIIEKDPSPDIYYRISTCQYEAGLYNEALHSIDKVMDTDSIDVDWLVLRADILGDMGKPNLAIIELNSILLMQPDFAWGYYKRGRLKYFCGDMDGAVEDLTTSIILDPEETYVYACRANVYTKKGQRDLAEADYKKIIEIEDAPDKYECIQYAYLALGLQNKAIEAMDTILARDPENAGNHYDAACLFSKMQNEEKALKHLEKAFELGFVNFVQVECDDDLDFIRNTEKFKALLDQYSSKNKTLTTSRIHSC